MGEAASSGKQVLPKREVLLLQQLGPRDDHHVLILDEDEQDGVTERELPR